MSAEWFWRYSEASLALTPRPIQASAEAREPSSSWQGWREELKNQTQIESCSPEFLLCGPACKEWRDLENTPNTTTKALAGCVCASKPDELLPTAPLLLQSASSSSQLLVWRAVPVYVAIPGHKPIRLCSFFFGTCNRPSATERSKSIPDTGPTVLLVLPGICSFCFYEPVLHTGAVPGEVSPGSLPWRPSPAKLISGSLIRKSSYWRFQKLPPCLDTSGKWRNRNLRATDQMISTGISGEAGVLLVGLDAPRGALIDDTWRFLAWHGFAQIAKLQHLQLILVDGGNWQYT